VLVEPSPDLGALEREIVARLREAGARLPPRVWLRWVSGEALLLDGELVLARMLRRERGGFHVDLRPEAGGSAQAENAATLLGPLADAWAAAVGGAQWTAPFDRGPGVYRLDEVDLAGVARAALGPTDVRILYLEASCYADCVFCGRSERLSDGTAEGLALAAIRGGEIDVRGAYVSIGGPEPTAADDLDAHVRALREAGAAEIATIATADPLTEVARARALRQAGLSTLSLPLYGADAATHDAIVRRTGSFDLLWRVAASARRAGLRVHLHSLLLHANAAQVPGMRVLAERDALSFVLGLPRAKGPKRDYLPTPAAVRRAAEAALVLGAPLCLCATAPRVPAPLLEVVGPMAIYFALQAGDFVAPCHGCGVRTACWGPPRGLGEIWSASLEARLLAP
jgi:hypothetical protein